MNPFSPLYEIHTAVYLNNLSELYGHRITIGSIPDSEIEQLLQLGIKSIWLMGVWRRSQTAVKIALEDVDFKTELENSLPGFSDKDLIGSAYSISSYTVDPRFGDNNELLKFRQRLNDKGIKLILDYVPNHVAMDHEWVRDNPDYFIRGTTEDIDQGKDYYADVDGRILALGRDPTFPAWTDVLQLNAFSDDYRQQSIETIKDIATLCDGVRCDMAMLLISKIFKETWADKAGPVPGSEYWQTVIRSVRKDFPAFSFIAEAYWDTEEELIRLGFDYCYDKQLYDYLLEGYASSVFNHIKATTDSRTHYLAFTENHDEVRAASVFSNKQAVAALAIIMSLPGIALINDGQLEGRRIKIPVHVDKGPYEESNDELLSAQRLLLDRFRSMGAWTDWRPYNTENGDIVGFQIARGNVKFLILINYSETDLHINIPDKTTGKDILNDEKIDLSQPVAMESWQPRIIQLISD